MSNANTSKPASKTAKPASSKPASAPESKPASAPESKPASAPESKPAEGMSAAKAKADGGKAKKAKDKRSKLAHPVHKDRWVRVYDKLHFTGEGDARQPKLDTFPHTRVDREGVRALLSSAHVSDEVTSAVLNLIEDTNRPFVEVAMTFTGTRSAGSSAEARAAKKAAREELEARIKAMSEEERKAYLEQQKQERKAAKERKVAEQRAAALAEFHKLREAGESEEQALARILNSRGL